MCTNTYDFILCNPAGQLPKFEKKKSLLVCHAHSTIVVTVELHKDHIHTCALKCMKLGLYSNNRVGVCYKLHFNSFTNTKNTTTNWENQTNRSFWSAEVSSLQLLAFYYHEAWTSKFVLRQRLKGISTSVVCVSVNSHIYMMFKFLTLTEAQCKYLSNTLTYMALCKCFATY